MLRNMVCNLSKGSHAAASNYRMSVNSSLDDLKEEKTVHQMIEDMDLGNQESHPTNIGQDEALNKHVFRWYFMLCRALLILGVFYRVYTSINFFKSFVKDDLDISVPDTYCLIVMLVFVKRQHFFCITTLSSLSLAATCF